jgi:hypothetical protein
MSSERDNYDWEAANMTRCTECRQMEEPECVGAVRDSEPTIAM